jgi:hypothetical protein
MVVPLLTAVLVVLPVMQLMAPASSTVQQWSAKTTPRTSNSRVPAAAGDPAASHHHVKAAGERVAVVDAAMPLPAVSAELFVPPRA